MTQQKTPQSLTALQLKSTVQSYARAVCKAQIELVNSFHAEKSISASAQEPGQPMSAAERQKYFEERQWAFPDFHFEATKIVTNPQKQIATYNWKVTGTFKQPFKGVKPNGRRIAMNGTTELQFEKGKIIRETSYQNVGALMKQLQAPPAKGSVKKGDDD
ncbi:MAG: ester cyclase [Pyrinomonadaceae bacterium]